MVTSQKANWKFELPNWGTSADAERIKTDRKVLMVVGVIVLAALAGILAMAGGLPSGGEYLIVPYLILP